MLEFTRSFFSYAETVLQNIDLTEIDKLTNNLSDLRKNNGRLFICGLGGSAGNASHAVNDFRKLCNIEAYSPTDNISELTARMNDEGPETIFIEYLRVSKFNSKDAILIMSVGGGSFDPPVSTGLILGINFVKEIGGKVFGIVGRDGGATKQLGDCVVVIPNSNDSLVTPLTESISALVWHCIVSHPNLKHNSTKW